MNDFRGSGCRRSLGSLFAPGDRRSSNVTTSNDPPTVVWIGEADSGRHTVDTHTREPNVLHRYFESCRLLGINCMLKSKGSKGIRKIQFQRTLTSPRVSGIERSHSQDSRVVRGSGCMTALFHFAKDLMPPI